MSLIQSIMRQGQKLDWGMKMSNCKESVMFMEGTPYLCGSDYSPEFLAKPLEEIEYRYNDQICESISDQEDKWGERQEPGCEADDFIPNNADAYETHKDECISNLR